MADVNPYWQNYIDGAWVDGGAGRIDVTDPATGERIAENALADAADVDRAVGAARRVHLSGALISMRPIERGRMVQAMGRYLLDHKDEIAHILTLEQRSALFRVLRQSGKHGRRPLDPPRRGLHGLDGIRAIWRLGPDHPVELPGRDDRALAFGGAGHRQCLRDQIARDDAAD
jgi:hypothetical protein